MVQCGVLQISVFLLTSSHLNAIKDCSLIIIIVSTTGDQRLCAPQILSAGGLSAHKLF